jgi:hypothetical protein
MNIQANKVDRKEKTLGKHKETCSKLKHTFPLLFYTPTVEAPHIFWNIKIILISA